MKNQKPTLHFIGIGGIGMSGIARVFLDRGYAVQGSDLKPSELMENLAKKGGKIFVGHKANHVSQADIVVYSSSIKKDHVEMAEAVRRGLRIMHRAKALAWLCEGKHTIAITGAHGKTTTTALVSTIFRAAGRDPSIVLGGVVNAFGGNAFNGKGPEIIIEADESDSSFLEFSPSTMVITNIEKEHMDHFVTMKNLKKAYGLFLNRLERGGHLVACAEDKNILQLIKNKKGLNKTLYSLTKKGADLTAHAIQERMDGEPGIAFSIFLASKRLGKVEMKLAGRHNVLNALAATAVGLKHGISFRHIAKALGAFEGTGRRFDVRHRDASFLIIDDYAHHPTEIRKTLRAAKTLCRDRIVAVFQPHRYTRTEALLKEFSRSFKDADKLFITDIYAASEKPHPTLNGESVKIAIEKAGHPDVVFTKRLRLVREVQKAMRPGDLVIGLGAGDITAAIQELCQSLKGANRV